MQWLVLMFASFLCIGLRWSGTRVKPGRATLAVMGTVAATLAIWYFQLSTST